MVSSDNRVIWTEEIDEELFCWYEEQYVYTEKRGYFGHVLVFYEVERELMTGSGPNAQWQEQSYFMELTEVGDQTLYPLEFGENVFIIQLV